MQFVQTTPDSALIDFDFDPFIQTSNPTCAIPFTRAGNLMLVKAKADNTEGNFILDTGAPGLVLNITYFRDYPHSGAHEAEQSGITGTGGPAIKTQVKKFNLGSFDYAKIEADMANLGHIENSKGIKVLGLIGLEFFKQCEMIIDYEKNLIYLHHISKKESNVYQHAMLNNTNEYRSIPIDIMDNRIVTTTEVAGKKLKVIIDCAAETNILNSKLPNSVFETVTISRKVKLAGSGAKKIDALYGDLKEMRIGDYNINNLPILITNLEGTCFSYNGCIDGVLGFDFLSLHKIGFNFVKRKMYIWK